MTAPEGNRSTTAHAAVAVALVWLVAAIGMTLIYWPDLAAGRYADGDDIMRLLEVRDWLGGQSWFDVSQHRIGPHGLSMHWTRLVDLPIAAVIMLVTPLAGAAAAEATADLLVPLGTLAAALTASTLAVRRLLGSGAAPAMTGAAFLIVAPAVFVQIHPTRIDHHGWQIVCAACAFAALLGARPIRAGVLAGLATGLLLTISLEGLPFAAAAAGAVGLSWACGMDDARRLPAFLASTLASCLLAILATDPLGRWSAPACDVVLAPHLGALGVAAAGATLIAARWQPGSRLPGVRVRLLLLVAIGGVAAGAYWALAGPACRLGPFGMLPPLSQSFWYDHVPEGVPAWRQNGAGALTTVGFPFVGLVGALASLHAASSPETRRRWLVAVVLGAASLALAIVLRRAAGVAHVIAIPGALAILFAILGRAAATRNLLARATMQAAALVLVSPLAWVLAGAIVFADKPAPAVAWRSGCDARCGLAQLKTLPPSLFFAPIDVAPPLLLATPYRAYTAAFHRSGKPMAETINAFLGSAAHARAIIRGSGARYLLILPDSDESRLYVKFAPDGFMAQLLRGRSPAWLERVETASDDIRLYRVRPDA